MVYNQQHQKSAIELVDIEKSFSGQPAINSINLSVPVGETLCICGANSAGKTTLLKIVAGLIKPDKGTVSIYGVNLCKEADKKLIGLISHKPMVYSQLTVFENLMFFAQLYGLKQRKIKIQEILEQTNIIHYRDDTVETLSRGTLQRLSIARVLIANPDILLADEPFAGLDNAAKKNLSQTINNLKSAGKTTLLTTHNIDLALQCCEQIAVLDAGKIIFKAAISEIDILKLKNDYLAYTRQNR